MGRVKREDKIILYKIMIWDFNHKEVKYMDVMKYFVREWKELSKKERDEKDLKEFILNKSMRFWSRCEYEIEVAGVPNVGDKPIIVDGFEQIEANIESVVEIFKINIGR